MNGKSEYMRIMNISCIRHVCDVHNEYLMYICDVRI